MGLQSELNNDRLIETELNNDRLTETIRCLMEENYDLGKLTRVKEILGGYCNKSYAVWMSANDHTHRYFLRLYNPEVLENEVMFEHALVKHLRSNGFTLAAGIIPCIEGTTLVETPPPDNHSAKRAIWALFEFLEGRDKYCWTDTELTDKELTSAAEALADLHHCGNGFEKPPGANRAQDRIMEFMSTFENTFSCALEQTEDLRYNQLFRDHINAIQKAIEGLSSLEIRFRSMPELPIHCDFHPGNLKFSDEKCVGVLDFDWAKIDYRLFDVALALVYFTSNWEKGAAGMKADSFSLFLRNYNETCQQLPIISPLTRQEQRYLAPMISIANLYVLNWEAIDFLKSPRSNDDEHYMFINHTIGLLNWIEENEFELEQWVKKSLN
jgi:homoserine kinase type II